MPSLAILLTTLLVAGRASADSNSTVGGFQDAPVGANETALLTKALASDALYGDSITARVCFSAIRALQEQVVAGTNYKFDVTACDVASAQDGQGKCPSSVLTSCSPREYEITVFEQPWTDTVRVSSIVAVGTGSNSSSGGNNNSSSDVTNAPSGAVPSPAPTTTKSSGVAVAAGGIVLTTVAFASAWL